MALNFDDEVVAALRAAKNATKPDEQLKAWQLLAALVHRTSLRERFPELCAVLPAPTHVRNVDTMPPSDDLKRVLQMFDGYRGVIRPEALFRALLRSPAAQQYLKERGVQPQVIQKVLERLEPGARTAEEASGQSEGNGSWRSSPERQRVIEQLTRYGRIMTEMPLKKGYWVGQEKVLEALLINLVKRPGKGRSTIVIGPPGVGKTGVVYELARRLREGDWKVNDRVVIPEQIRDVDIFQLFPAYLRAGTSLVGEYEKRLKELIQLLEPHPKIILFVDEVHSFLQSGMHHGGAFSQANEALKGPLMEGQITLIGCTTTAEYRHFIEPDPAMAQRFSTVVIEPMDAVAALEVLKQRRKEIEEHFHVELTDELLQSVVDLTEEYMPTDCQPRKSIRLLEDACARCLVRTGGAADAAEQSGLRRLSKTDLEECLETRTGVKLVRQRTFTVQQVRSHLTASLVGQDEVLGKVAEEFVAGFGHFGGEERTTRNRPRGVWLFGGPTGVGKTEAARLLAKLLGDGEKELWIRVDCNTLLGSGFDSSPAVNRLLGVPPGFIGYARGEGGLLSQVRDRPECIVLFDEFEKADPGVGKLLLQIIDEGKVQDTEGNWLDFRRSFVIFTTNVGCTYESGPELGFLSGKQAVEEPHAELVALRKELRAMGLGEEFLARMDHVFLFRALSEEATLEIIGKQLSGLRAEAEKQGFQLDWDEDLPRRVARRWTPRHGARALTHMLGDRVINQLKIAEIEGQLEGVERIHVSAEAPPPPAFPGEFPTLRKVTDGTLIVFLQEPEEPEE